MTINEKALEAATRAIMGGGSYADMAEAAITAYLSALGSEPVAWKLVPAPRFVTLKECPVGLFVHETGELCLKTEYGNNEGRIDAYIVDSGEFFWGSQPQSIANQRRQMVRPVTVSKVPEAPHE